MGAVIELAAELFATLVEVIIHILLGRRRGRWLLLFIFLILSGLIAYAVYG